MTPSRAGPYGLLFACLALFGAVFLWPLFTPRRPLHAILKSSCLSNVKQSAIGLLLYAGDSDDRLPGRDEWMDRIVPYTKNEWIFLCPEAPRGMYGYAFNGALSQFDTKRLKAPDKTALIYESVNPIRNASDLVASVPLKGRHRSSGKTSNNVAYADGHAKSLPGGVLP